MKKIFFTLIIITTLMILSIFHKNDNTILNAQDSESEVTEILKAHNKYRKVLDIPPLKWSVKLAKDAKVWAIHLASVSRMYHSPDRNGAGENIWMGTAGHYSLSDMVESWGGERDFYMDGIFPNVTTGGVVGHYTQIIWRNTTEVGCAKSSDRSDDYFVCRYYPPGNYIGQKVY